MTAKSSVLSSARAMSAGATAISPARRVFVLRQPPALIIFFAKVSELSWRIACDKCVARRNEKFVVIKDEPCQDVRNMQVSPKLPLKSQRLSLREFVEADWRSVHSYASDSEVFRYVEGGPFNEQQSRDSVQRAIASQRENPRLDFRLAVTLKMDGNLIGDCRIRILDTNLHPVYRLLGQGYIGFYLNRKFWGQGYASEAAQSLLAFGFDQLGLHRIFAWCDTENRASARVLEKIGMRREGVLLKNWTVRGELRDAFLYAIIEPMWGKSDAKAGVSVRR